MSGMHFIKNAKELSAESLDRWGDQIGSRKLSREIASLDRFNDRVVSQVFASEPAMSTPSSAQQRMGGVSGQARLTEEDLAAAQALREDAASLVKICGIVAFGDVFRKNVTNASFAGLQRHFSQRELRIGCQLRDEHRSFSQQQIDMDRLPELTSIAGNHCVATWMTSLPSGLLRELEMIGIYASSFEANDQIGINQDHCVRIVRSVANQLAAH